MAGRRSATRVIEPEAADVPATEDADSTLVEAEQVEDGDVEGTEVSDESTEEKPAKAPVVVDISGFIAAVQAGLESKDVSTGVMDEKSSSDILAVYRALDGAKNKSAARKWTDDGMKEAVDNADIATARALMTLSANLSSAPSVKVKGEKATREPKAPVDPTDAFVRVAARLKLAMKIHADSADESIGEDWKDKANAKVEELIPQLDTWATYLDAEDEDLVEPDVDPLVKAAFKTAAGKASGSAVKRAAVSSASGDGIRRSVGKHLASAFAEVPVGTFLSVAQIRAHRSEEYGDTAPSAGAITARLFPVGQDKVIKPTTVVGLEGATDENDHKGALKIGDVTA